MVNQLAHEHRSGHHSVGHNHGVDMDHPVLALGMTTVAIGVKEGYGSILDGPDVFHLDSV